jgi:hypothetical protein
MEIVVGIMLFLFAVGFIRDFPYPRPVHRKMTSWNMLVDYAVYLNIAVAAGWFAYFIWPFIPALNLPALRERPIEWIFGWGSECALSAAACFFAFMAYACAAQIYENITGSQFAER